MRRRLGPDEQAIFGMLLAGIDPSEVASTLGISPAGLDSRRWAMLHKLEGLRPEPIGAERTGDGPAAGARRGAELLLH